MWKAPDSFPGHDPPKCSLGMRASPPGGKGAGVSLFSWGCSRGAAHRPGPRGLVTALDSLPAPPAARGVQCLSVPLSAPPSLPGSEGHFPAPPVSQGPPLAFLCLQPRLPAGSSRSHESSHSCAHASGLPLCVVSYLSLKLDRPPSPSSGSE